MYVVRDEDGWDPMRHQGRRHDQYMYSLRLFSPKTLGLCLLVATLLAVFDIVRATNISVWKDFHSRIEAIK